MRQYQQGRCPDEVQEGDQHVGHNTEIKSMVVIKPIYEQAGQNVIMDSTWLCAAIDSSENISKLISDLASYE